MTNNKFVAIITGASRGIGKYTAIELARGGKVTHLAITSRKESDLQQVAQELAAINNKLDVITIAADLQDPTSAQKIIDATVQVFSQIDLVILNAGYSHPSNAADHDYSLKSYYDTEIFKIFQINLLASIQVTTYAIPYLRKTKGTIVYISSGTSKTAFGGLSLYGPAKAALNHFGAHVAVEEKDIISLVLAPGFVDTDMATHVMTVGEQVFDEKTLKFFDEVKTNGGMLKPENVGRRIALLSQSVPREWSGKYVDDVNTDEQVKELIGSL